MSRRNAHCLAARMRRAGPHADKRRKYGTPAEYEPSFAVGEHVMNIDSGDCGKVVGRSGGFILVQYEFEPPDRTVLERADDLEFCGEPCNPPREAP